MPGQPPEKSNLSSRRGARGFTLVELLVVIAIIGVLATIAIPMYQGYVNKAKITLALNALDSMRKTFEAFHIDYSEYPTPPMDFTTGRDARGRVVFPQVTIDQLREDLFSIDSYTLVDQVYTVTAKAKDDAHKVMTMTAQGTTY